MPSGKKIFRLAYRSAGKQRTVWIGDYPSVGLSEARLKAAEFKMALRQGIDPKTKKDQARAEEIAASEPNEPIWRDVASDYLMLRQRSGAAKRTMAKLDRQVGLTIQALGNRPLSSISAEDVLGVVNPIADRGHVENAHEVRTRFSQIFRYAAARGLIAHDPAAFTIGAMVKRRRGSFAGLTKPEDVGRLLNAIHRYREEHFFVGSALLLSAYLFPRNSELRGMLWGELDWDRRIWEVPASRMKMKREHIVPLSRQALAVLQEVREIELGSELVLPSPLNPQRTCSEMTFNSALRRMGFSPDEHVHHGFRTTASTNLNEMGWNSDWIERQLAHVQSNKVRSAYNKAEYLEGRTEMMQAYADWLDAQALR
jgi:integrase